MIPDLLTCAAMLAQLACFAVIARASYRFFRQGESAAHMLTRLANIGATGVFLVLVATGAGGGVWAVGALALTGISAWIFHRAVASAREGVLPVAFAQASSARLVTEGIYARIRNPFYTSYLLYWAAWAVLLGFAWPGVMGLAFFATLYWTAVLREERALAEQFGAEYAAYKARAGRFVPRLAS